ncbi:MAG TPA: ISAs1 family transposase [Dermatophilaceae bacterium]|nr:ISAs1 family transposase [Dermatophilaceae bacterium]
MATSTSTGLLSALGAVSDPRKTRGVRHRFVSVLAVGICAVLAGAKSFAAIADWAHDLPPGVRASLGIGRVPPSESTIRRMLQQVDPDHLDQVISGWLLAQHPAPTAAIPTARVPVRVPARKVFAVDGKSARGSRCGQGRAVHLFAALDQHTGTVLGQVAVDAKTNEINAFGPLLDRIDITGAVITADALHTQRGHVDYLTGRGAHYILVAKANQPTLYDQLRSIPWKDIPAADTTTGKGHGRRESRTVKLTEVRAGIDFPGARLAIQVIRTRNRPGQVRATKETVYAITSLSHDDATATQLADAIRGHWSIEVLHWIRDVTFAEDLSQIRTGAGPQVMAGLRNLAVSLHRLAGQTNIAAACRRVNRYPERVLSLIG